MSTLEIAQPPWIVGHRGAAGEACENTVASFVRARRAGADMIELDVQLARDARLVCFHDWTLERLAGRADAIEEEISTDLVEIPICEDGSRIPLLGDALEAIAESMPVNVELKRNRVSAARLAAACVDAIAHRPNVLVSSFDWDLLCEVRKLAPGFALSPIARHHPERLIAAGRELGAFSLHCHRRIATTAFVERAADAGFTRVLTYTVNDRAEAEALLSAGITGFFTDVPTTMVEHLRGPA